jgi:hypothetical protein
MRRSLGRTFADTDEILREIGVSTEVNSFHEPI